MNELNKNCPSCNKLIVCKTISQYNESIKKNRTCRSCASKRRGYKGILDKICVKCGIKYTFSNYRKYKTSKNPYFCKSCALSIAHKGKHISEKNKEILRNIHLGAKLSEETKRKISEKTKGKNNPCYGRVKDKNPMYGKFGELSPTFGKIPWMKGKHHTEKSLEKMRISALNRIKEFGVISYNKDACIYFNKLNKNKGWNLQHAMNGGEINFIGYSVDGYDKDKNIIVEYDEPHHYDRQRNLKEKDKKRMDRLKKSLNCRFFRYNERLGELKEY